MSEDEDSGTVRQDTTASEDTATTAEELAADRELGLPHIYRDAGRYDVLAQMTAPDDQSYWRGIIGRHGGPVLEVGCGTGRVCIEMAKLGVEVWGLDRSMELLLFAKQKAEAVDVPLVLAPRDMRDFTLDRAFRLIVLPYNVINHLLSADDLRGCFSSILQHMDEGAHLVIDTFQPSLSFLGADPARRRPILRYRDPYSGEEVLLSEENHYDPATQINAIRWIYRVARTGEESIDEMRMRLFFPAELDALLALAGFEIVSKHGEYDESAFGSTATKQLITCRRAVSDPRR